MVLVLLDARDRSKNVEVLDGTVELFAINVAISVSIERSDDGNGDRDVVVQSMFGVGLHPRVCR